MQQNSIPLSSIIPALLAVFGMLSLNLDTIRTSRPPPPVKTVFNGLEEPQTISALLWQDPLSAVDSVTEQTVLRQESSPPPAGSSGAEPGASLLVIPVIVNSGSFAEQIESRSRTRKAVVEALGSCDYIPKNRDHIGCFTLPWQALDHPAGPAAPQPASSPTTAGIPGGPLTINLELMSPPLLPFRYSSLFQLTPTSPRPPATPPVIEKPLKVPFEWFTATNYLKAEPRDHKGTPGSKAWKDVLILWIRSDAVNSKPLGRINRLVDLVIAHERNAKRHSYLSDPSAAAYEVRILGPSNSTGLVKMVEELEEQKPRKSASSPSFPHLPKVKVYSAHPTAPTGHIARHADLQGTDPNSAVYNLFNDVLGDGKASPCDPAEHLIRTVATDEQICRALLDELERRGVRTRAGSSWIPFRPHKPDNIAIIAEWDTEYGRTLPRAFAQEALIKSAVGSQSTPAQSASPEKAWPEWIHSFTYLQGLDGRTTETAKDKPAPKLTDLADYAEAMKNTPLSESVTGQNHADYLRRLAGLIAAKDRELRRDSGRGIRAVGVLGSDVYDKLMILRALKAELPDMLFFANNLDTLLYHKDELRVTRNLIVASPYGLQLHPTLQGGVGSSTQQAATTTTTVAPFRDTYQTAIYSGMLTLMGRIHDEHFPRTRSTSTGPQPQLFEIGRSGPWNISLRSSASPVQGVQLHPDRPDLTPPGHGRWDRHVSRWGVFTLALALLAWAWTYRSGRSPLAAPVAGELASPGTVTTFKRLLYLALAVEFTFFLVRVFMQDTGEPFARFSGISLWPAEAMRVTVIVLAWQFGSIINQVLRSNYETVTKEYFADPDRTTLTNLLDAHPTTWQALFKWQSVKDEFRKLLTRPQHDELDSSNPVQLWEENLKTMSPGQRTLRWLISALLYTLAALVLLRAVDDPPARFRGGFIHTIDILLNFTSFFILAFISFAVADILRHGTDLIRHLNNGTTKWDTTLPLFDKCPHGAAKVDAVREWMDMQFMVTRTQMVGRLVMFPIWLLALVLIARLPCFDKFPWRLWDVLALGGCVAYACSRAAVLRIRAEHARRGSIERIEALKLSTPKPTAKACEALDQLAKDFAAESGGAFAPWTQQPFVRLILWLVSVFGLGSLATYLTVVLG